MTDCPIPAYAVILISLVIILSGYLLHVHHVVKRSSPCLLTLRQINSRYHFYQISPQYTYYINLPTKYSFDHYSCDTLFQAKLAVNYSYWKSIQIQLESNSQLLQQYVSDVNRSCVHGVRPVHCHIPRFLWRHYENRIFQNEKLSPTTFGSITCVASYTSPKGRNRYKKSARYSFSEIDFRYNALRQEQERKSSVEYQKKKERSKMSSSLRYDILKRDHFRCQLCGRSASDGVELEVDHIIPISKGGKTVPDNLRTLCKDCNRGKSAKFE